MVCDRCIYVVEGILKKLGVGDAQVYLGEVEIGGKALNQSEMENLSSELNSVGFELIDDRKSRQIESIKNLIIKLVHHSEDLGKLKVSDCISQALHMDYSHLSHLFSSVEGITIEQYLIRQKVERVKELLVYDELNLTQIASKLGYSSSAHMSNQFKKLTGLSPSHFKRLRDNKKRFPLDKL